MCTLKLVVGRLMDRQKRFRNVSGCNTLWLKVKKKQKCLNKVFKFIEFIILYYTTLKYRWYKYIILVINLKKKS